MSHTMAVSNRANLIDFPFSANSLPKAALAVKSEQQSLTKFGALYGASRPMQRLYKLIEKVAPTDATVLVIGESGTGKEVVANTIHQMSGRSGQPFLAINCGAIPSNLIEAELFGYERGSFTGANRMHKGYFERAAGGTIFLDEITEMAPELQVKLLRVLETGAFCRVGGDQEIRVKVRIIAATNRRPETAVASGQFREDLMYRLSVFPIEVPPLRNRGTDIELLAQHFLNELNESQDIQKTFSPHALNILREHNWPGNVRELKNIIHRAFILADDLVELDGLLYTRRDVNICSDEGLRFPVGTPLAEAERHLIFATLEHYDGNKKKAAEVLGLSLKTLYNRLSEYRVQDPQLESAISVA